MKRTLLALITPALMSCSQQPEPQITTHRANDDLIHAHISSKQPLTSSTLYLNDSLLHKQNTPHTHYRDTFRLHPTDQRDTLRLEYTTETDTGSIQQRVNYHNERR